MSMIMTGPSSVESEIIPISINQKGQILCKTRFTKNVMGSYSPMRVEYGFCILTSDSIIEIRTKIINPDKFKKEEVYYKELNFWDKIFRMRTNKEQLNLIKTQVFKNKHDFPSINVDKYKIDEKISISEFEKQKKISLKQRKQKALKNATSTEYHSKNTLYILYDFGDIIILKNEVDFDEDIEIGAYFDYMIPWTNQKGLTENINFDVNKIVGILNLK